MRIVKGEGMPKSKQPGQKGDLRIVFDVQVRHRRETCMHACLLCACCSKQDLQIWDLLTPCCGVLQFPKKQLNAHEKEVLQDMLRDKY